MCTGLKIIKALLTRCMYETKLNLVSILFTKRTVTSHASVLILSCSFTCFYVNSHVTTKSCNLKIKRYQNVYQYYITHITNYF